MGPLPFFLRPGEETVSKWLSGLGFDRDAPRGEVMKKAFGGPRVLEQLDKLNVQAGLSPSYWNAQFADTMDSHRLAMYAAAVSPVKGEAFWKATSRRYFEGKDTQISPIRLDSHEMLMECAAEAGLDLQKARKVLESDMYRNEVWQTVRQMHQAGINSIPVLIFEVDGVSKNPMVHHGSGHKEDFRSILLQLHAEAATAKL